MSGPATHRPWRSGRNRHALGRRRGLDLPPGGAAPQPDLTLCQPSGRGKYRCLVCGTVHADVTALALHQRSQRHAASLERLRMQEESRKGESKEIDREVPTTRDTGQPGQGVPGDGASDRALTSGGTLAPLLGETEVAEERRRLREQYFALTSTGLPHLTRLRDMASKVSSRTGPRQFLKEYYETGAISETVPTCHPLRAALEDGTRLGESSHIDDFSFSTSSDSGESDGVSNLTSMRIYIPPRTPPTATPEMVVTRVIHPKTGERGMLLELLILDSPMGSTEFSLPRRPAWRVVSSFEQETEPIDPRFQYVVVACPPYQNVAIRVENSPVHLEVCTDAWFPDCGLFCVQVFFSQKRFDTKTELQSFHSPREHSNTSSSWARG